MIPKATGVRRYAAMALAVACSCSKAPPPHVPTGPNPLGDPSTPALPFPSSYFLVENANTATGYQVDLLKSVFPKAPGSPPLDPSGYNRFDGFSPATSILLYFPSTPDLSNVASYNDFGPSLDPASPIQVFNMRTGERILFFAELDANVTDPIKQRQTLFLRPQIRLDSGTRYVVAVLNTLVDTKRNLLPSTPAFAEVRDKKVTSSSALYDMQDRFEEIFSFLGGQGIVRSDLVLAFDFITASEDTRINVLVQMRDQMFSGLSGNYQVTSAQDSPNDPNILRTVQGTFDVPNFMTTKDNTGVLNRDANDQPAVNGTNSFPFFLHIPQCAATAKGPLPIMIYGHGLFGSADTEMSTAYQEQLIEQLCFVQVGTNWIGLSSDDLGVNDALANVTELVLPDLNKFNLVTDRLMQAHLNFQALEWLVKNKLVNDPNLQIGGKPVSDASQLYYFGISLGAIQGATFMSLNPDIVRGTLNVGGGEWSLLMFRSADFGVFTMLVALYYPDPADQALLFHVAQALWDYTDPIDYATHLLRDPLPGVPPKQILYQESIGDTQVPNLATRLMVRTMEMPALEPLVQEPYGLDDEQGPLPSAYEQFDVSPSPLPGDTNVPPPGDNQAHDDCRKLPAVIQQIQQFLQPNGLVVQTCDGGPCIFSCDGGPC
jgi:hypothetical protein